ncbi:hypothetical protein IFR05_010741 [Cadophora sp. M221]|nr:hypothetical protein IFR05_010741 [Cadophora sp. M221]
MSTNSGSSGVLQLNIGSSVFTASLLDNPTALTFQNLLPLNLQMSELNGNDKHGELPTSLPTSASNLGAIRVGDLMLYGSQTLVLWYEDYSSSFTYTRIGRIDDSERLVAAIGSGAVDVGFAAAGNTLAGTPTTTPPRSTPSTNGKRAIVFEVLRSGNSGPSPAWSLSIGSQFEVKYRLPL